MYEVEITPEGVRHLNQLPAKVRAAAIELMLGPVADAPKRVGKPLLGELAGLFSARMRSTKTNPWSRSIACNTAATPTARGNSDRQDPSRAADTSGRIPVAVEPAGPRRYRQLEQSSQGDARELALSRGLIRRST